MEDLDLEGTEPVSGPPPGAEALQGPLRLDLDSDELPSYRQDEGERNVPAPRPAPLPAALQEETPAARELRELKETARNADQRAQMALGAITPYLASLQAKAYGDQKPRPTLEQILHDPNVTTEQLISYIQGSVGDQMTHQQQLMEVTARRGASEQYARGLFNGDGYQGRDFDTMRTKYIQPVLERIPYLRDVLTTLNPEAPAMAEYGLAALLEISARAKDDPATFYRNLWALVDNQAGADTAARIQQGARHAAARIARGSETGRQVRARGNGYSAREIETMSDKEFDRLDGELTGGL